MGNLAQIGELGPDEQVTSTADELNQHIETAVSTAVEAAVAEAKEKGGDWKDNLDPSLKSVVDVKGWKTPGDVISSYSETEKLIGGEKLAAPRKDKEGNYEAGEMERVADQLGRPKESKDYVKPEGSQLQDEALGNFKEAAHKMGLLPHQFKGVLDYYTNLAENATKTNAEKQEKDFNEASLNLKTKWGMTYDEKMKRANDVLRTFGNKEKGAEIAEKYGNDPVIIELLANVGENLSEDSLSTANMSGALLTPEAAQMEINKIKADKGHPYMNSMHPDHDYWVKKVAEYYKMTS